jgi:signal transduction histidine kinase
MERPPDPAFDRHPRLVLRFALYAGAVLLAAGVAIAWLVNRQVADRAERTVESQARAAVVSSLDSQLRPSDFRAPVTGARRVQLDGLFRHGRVPGVVGGRLVAPGGTVTYAADHRLIGTRSGPLPRKVERSVARTDTWDGRKDLKVLRVFVPVQLQGGRTLGTVELEQDYRAVAVPLGDARVRLVLILSLALLLLYVALFPILKRVTRQLQEQNRLLAARNERLRELDELKNEFVSLVSHELRTPLTSIRGYVELLVDNGGLDEEQRRFLGVVERNADRLLDLVSDLLFLAQVDAGKLEFERKPVDLALVVAECLESSAPEASRKGITLDAQVRHVPELQGDQARLAQVLDNLVSNALKFTPSGGRVEVRLGVEGDAAVLEVADTGQGLAEDEQSQLFERFFRSSRAAENAIPGTGLGLAIAKTIVERHGGRIALESGVDAGTTVRVELPLQERAAEPSPAELAA